MYKSLYVIFMIPDNFSIIAHHFESNIQIKVFKIFACIACLIKIGTHTFAVHCWMNLTYNMKFPMPMGFAGIIMYDLLNNWWLNSMI